MLRTIQSADAPEILTIERLTQISPWTIDIFERCWEAGYLGWLIEEENRIVGFIVTSFQAAEVHILNICVHPDFQHQGYGQKLMEHVLALAKARENGIVFLEVRKSNKKAISLYQKLHFVQIGERKNYYLSPQGNEDALVFALDMSVL